ncbi:MAG TPA: response regulator [Gaiellaceae bacterium]|nr:response regulator [Gaiellaceae bacterium]
MASLLEKGLRSSGHSTAIAGDGGYAQELALTGSFDMVILDMGLPVRDGLDVLRELRSRGSTVLVLVLTGRSDRHAAECLAAGADDYMRKPFRFDELLARVDARLRTKQQLDELRRELGRAES